MTSRTFSRIRRGNEWRAGVAISLLCLIAAGCARPLIPAWRGKIYAGDPEARAVVRRQAGEAIPADDPRFATLRCMTSDDLRRFWETYVLGCREWHGDRIWMAKPEEAPGAGAPPPAAAPAQ